MGFFRKNEKRPVITEMKYPAEGCPFTCALLKRHVDWRHPELARNLLKAEEMSEETFSHHSGGRELMVDSYRQII